jgi:hypothetical protein
LVGEGDGELEVDGAALWAAAQAAVLADAADAVVIEIAGLRQAGGPQDGKRERRLIW